MIKNTQKQTNYSISILQSSKKNTTNNNKQKNNTQPFEKITLLMKRLQKTMLSVLKNTTKTIVILKSE